MIACTLREIIPLAAARWRVALSERAVARLTTLSVVTVNRLARDHVDRYDFMTVGLLCNLFWCEVGELVVYRRVGDPSPLARPTLDAIRRPELPDVVREPLLPLHTSIPERVRQYPPQRFAATTGLARSTVDRLAAGELQRIDRATLDALCCYWAVDVGDLLTVELPVAQPTRMLAA
jgi:DNA-binding Xre family transcriptional regulator